MLLAIVLLLAGIVVELVAIYVRLTQLLSENETSTQALIDVKKLQLNPRTRIGQSSMQSGVEAPEKTAAKVGRATASNRVVVGGDPESDLNQQQSRRGLFLEKEVDDV